MDAEESITLNGAQPKDDETRWNHKKRSKDCFLMFCEVVLQHERELLTETLNSSQESINENRVPESGQIGNDSTDSDGGANGEMAAYTNEGGEGGGDGDSFNSVTCFCGKPFAGRPMIECSGCLTWLHMSCAKVKRKNIPEFYYCDNCKSNSLLSPTLMNNTTTSSGEETLSPMSQNGTSTLSSNTNSINDGGSLFANTARPRKPKSMKKMMMSSSSDNIKNNASDSKKSSASSGLNGKLKKSSTKKMMRQSPTKATKAYTSSMSSLAAAASLTELSLNHQVSMIPNGGENILLKSPIATNNNIYDETPAIDTENGGGDLDKFNNKRLKTL